MWNLFKKLFKRENGVGTTDTPTSIQKLVSFNALNRRKNIRIHYPHLGAMGPYPRIYYKDHEVVISNISVGGILIIDDTESFGSNVGDMVILQLVWPEETIKIRARIVGANMKRRHIQFVDFNAAAFLKISRLVKPAYQGSRFYKIHDESGKLNAREVWVGPTQESLIFPNFGFFAELLFNQKRIIFERGRPTRYAETEDPIAPEQLDDILVLLSNIPSLTNLVRELVEMIEIELHAIQKQKTGTHG